MRPKRPADPFIEPEREEKTSFYSFQGEASVGEEAEVEKNTDAAINNILRSCVVVNIDCYPAKGGDFRGKFGETRVILSQWRTS